MNILFYISGYDGCGYYRIEMVAKYLNKYPEVHARISTKYSKEEIRWADIVVLQKQSNQNALDFVRYAKYLGKYIVTEVDDDFFNIPPWNPAYKHYVGKKQDLINFYKLSDMITVTTPHLQKELSEYSSRVEVLPNSLDFNFLDKISSYDKDKLFSYTKYMDASKKEISLERALDLMQDRIIIGWGGSPTHLKDLELVTDSLIELCEHDSRVMVQMIGCSTERIIKHIPKEQLMLVASVPIFRYPQLLHSMRWDIGICPIVDNKFNRSKSNLKYLEFASNKFACVCSNVENYRSTINHGVEGLLSQNTSEEWYKHLKKLTSGNEYVRKLQNNGYALVRDKYNISKNISMWYEVYKSLLA